MNLLSEDVTLWADGGGKIKQAALRPIRGRDAVARFSLGTKRFWPENARVELEEVNSQVALIIRAGGQIFSVLTIEVEEGRFGRFGSLPTRTNSHESKEKQRTILLEKDAA
jgi:RNA polymerase sigma-70 factor (ECF subfamily)